MSSLPSKEVVVEKPDYAEPDNENDTINQDLLILSNNFSMATLRFSWACIWSLSLLSIFSKSFSCSRRASSLASRASVRVSKSFLRATPAAVEQAMITVLSRRLAFEAGSLATTGTGASNGQPHGIVPRSSAGTTSSSNNAIVADEWTQLPYKVDSVNWGSWMLNQKIMGLLASLRDTGGQFLFRLDTDATGRGILNNLPYNFNPAMAESVAANAVIGLFGNMRAYATRVVDLQEIQILRELYAAQGDIGFAMEFEVGGDILDAEAIKKLQAAA